MPTPRVPQPETAPATVSPALARRMYQRTLAGWARDALMLRLAGLDRPGLRARPARAGSTRAA